MQIKWCVYVFGLLNFKLITSSAAWARGRAIFLWVRAPVCACAAHNYIQRLIRTNDKAAAFMKFDAYCLCVLCTRFRLQPIRARCASLCRMGTEYAFTHQPPPTQIFLIGDFFFVRGLDVLVGFIHSLCALDCVAKSENRLYIRQRFFICPRIISRSQH